MTKPRNRRALVAAVGAVAAIAVPAASAASLGTSLQPTVGTVLSKVAVCQGRDLSQPFAPWGDQNWYFPVDGGSFEQDTTGWALAGGAAVTPGGDTLLASSDGGALTLPAGATATTPSTCVDAASPTVRFFVQGSGTVTVSSLIGGVWLPIGRVSGGNGWAPTPAMLNVGSLLSLLTPTGTSTAQFRFTGSNGTVTVDDVYVDPYRRT